MSLSAASFAVTVLMLHLHTILLTAAAMNTALPRAVLQDSMAGRMATRAPAKPAGDSPSERQPRTASTATAAPGPAPDDQIAPIPGPMTPQPTSAEGEADVGEPPPSVEETRLTLSKWIETQQIIAKERNDWQQGKEILEGRIELVSKEVSQLKERIAQSEAAVAESNRKRDKLAAENAQLKETGGQLSGAVTVMEAEVQKLARLAPEGLATKLAPLLQRIPTDATTTRVSAAERFQNVLGILNELNKANSEITIAYEVRQMADGSSSEVQVIYVGLAQAYYLSPRGEAGIGRPTAEGWTWRPAPEEAGRIYTALEIIQGKHPPAFVGLPINIQ
jgi:hypothetical protein